MRLYEPLETTPIIETLQGILERLCAPDLTVAEAQDLHPRLIRLIETIEAQNLGQAGEIGNRTATAARESKHCLVV